MPGKTSYHPISIERVARMDIVISEVQPRALPQAVAGKRFGIRAGAYIIDYILFYVINYVNSFVVSIVIMFILAFITGQVPEVSEQDYRILDIIISIILFIIYFTVFEWLYGASPGKLILKMRVVMEDGSPCSLRAAIHRGVLRLIDGILFGLVAYENMKEPLYQRIGDKRAKTIVVGSRDGMIQQPREWWWFVIATGLFLAIQTIVNMFLVAWLFR
jgi:uncharacterized RDD family membrane protein YckC